MLKYTGIFVFIVGLANIGSDPSPGWLILMIGMGLIGYGYGRVIGLLATLVLLPPILGYAKSGWAGFAIGVFVTAVLIAGMSKLSKQAFAKNGYELAPGLKVIGRTAPAGLYGRINTVYPDLFIERKEHESPQEYKSRKFWAEWGRGADQYEIEVVPGVIRCPGGPNLRLNFIALSSIASRTDFARHFQKRCARSRLSISNKTSA